MEILGLISRGDSVIQSLQPIMTDQNRGILADLSKTLSDYSGGFDALVEYVVEFPPDKRIAHIRSRMDAESGKFSGLYKKLREEIQSAKSTTRDSLLAEAVKHIDIFSLDRIASQDAGSAGNAKTLFSSKVSIHPAGFHTHREPARRPWVGEYGAPQTGSLRIEARAKRNILFIVILTGILCAIIVMFLPKSIVKPLKNLGAHIRGVGNGGKNSTFRLFRTTRWANLPRHMSV